MTSLGEKSSLPGLHLTLNLVEVVFKGLNKIVDRVDVRTKLFQREIALVEAKHIGNIIFDMSKASSRKQDFGFRRADFDMSKAKHVMSYYGYFYP